MRLLKGLGVLTVAAWAWCLAGGASASAAVQDTASMEVVPLDEVVVSASRTPQPLKRIPVITRVVPRQQIERMSPRSVVDMLMMAIPGISLMRHGSQERMVIQGLSADYTLFLVDGERLSSEGSGTVDLHRVDPSAVERIEIIQGAASALYGSNAVGGVVNIITRRPDRPVEASVSGFYDIRGLQQYNASVGVNRGGFHSLSRGGWNGQREYELPAGGGRYAMVPGSDTWHVEQKLGYRNDSLRVHLDVGGGYNRRVQSWDDKQKNLYGGYSADARLRYAPMERCALDVSYHLDGYTRDTYYYTAKEDPIEPVFAFLTHTVRAQFSTTPAREFRPSFVAGLDVINEGLRSDRFEDRQQLYSAATYSLYGQCDWQLFRHFTMTAGLRQDLHSLYNAHITPRMALMYQRGIWSMRLSYAEGFRSPTLKEMYMKWDHLGMFSIEGNRELSPERSRMVAFSPEVRFRNMHLTLLGTYNALQDRIFLRSEANGQVQRYTNMEGQSRILVGQALLRLRLPAGFSLHINYSYTYDYVAGESLSGGRINLSSTRPHSLTGMLSYEWVHRRFAGSVDFSGFYYSGLRMGVYSREQKGFEEVWYPGYALFRVGVTHRFDRYVSLTLGCENLLDYVSEQLSVSTSLSPGRSYFARLTLSI